MITRAALILIIAMTLSGCFFWRNKGDACESVQEYQSARSGAKLEVPAGLDKPDESAGLKVPDGPIPAEPLAKKAECLQRPPNYSDKGLPVPAK